MLASALPIQRRAAVLRLRRRWDAGDLTDDGPCWTRRERRQLEFLRHLYRAGDPAYDESGV